MWLLVQAFVSTREELFVDNVVLNKSLLAVWLERLTDVDWSENTIYSLLNPGPSAVMTQCTEFAQSEHNTYHAASCAFSS